MWFLACLYSQGKLLGMPSKAVDTAWHEFILITREYQSFCDEAFGYFLHHAPEATLDEPMSGALVRTLDVIDRQALAMFRPRVVDGVPLLFAIDKELGIPGGYVWTRDDVERLRRRDGGGGGGGGCGGSSSDCDGGGGGGCGGGCGGG